ncbi:hypothetical protein MHBO_003058 [Bonamia ostreae]|uniref:Protein kinase domain-containing protein n=1 Tax=Bonamia ostreae TaxID=126728 RepID=A0ABV2AQB1_9EUKA
MGRQSISKNKRRKIALSDKIVSSSKSVISDKDADDKNSGLIKISAGDVIYNRFEVLRKCGQGTFGTVLSCYDKNKQKKVAIKAIRSVRRYLKSADIEIKILEKIYKADLHDDSLCVKLRKSFTDHVHGRRHKFIVFEKLGCSLYDFISQNNYKGFSLRHVKEFSYQILKAVRFCHRMNLIHTEFFLILKPY